MKTNMRALGVLSAKYQAEMDAALVNIQVYENSVGIGEHPDIVSAVEEQVKRFAEAKELFDAINAIVDSV